MVAYIIFSHYIYESSAKEVDMIINATKNLEEYRNSVVFKQINIPVMQLRETNLKVKEVRNNLFNTMLHLN